MVFIEVDGCWLATEKLVRDKIFSEYLSSLLTSFFVEQGFCLEGDVWVHHSGVMCRVVML